MSVNSILTDFILELNLNISILLYKLISISIIGFKEKNNIRLLLKFEDFRREFKRENITKKFKRENIIKGFRKENLLKKM